MTDKISKPSPIEAGEVSEQTLTKNYFDVISIVDTLRENTDAIEPFITSLRPVDKYKYDFEDISNFPIKGKFEVYQFKYFDPRQIVTELRLGYTAEHILYGITTSRNNMLTYEAYKEVIDIFFSRNLEQLPQSITYAYQRSARGEWFPPSIDYVCVKKEGDAVQTFIERWKKYDAPPQNIVVQGIKEIVACLNIPKFVYIHTWGYLLQLMAEIENS